VLSSEKRIENVKLIHSSIRVTPFSHCGFGVAPKNSYVVAYDDVIGAEKHAQAPAPLTFSIMMD